MNEDAQVKEALRGNWRRRSPLDRSALGVEHAKYLVNGQVMMAQLAERHEA